VAALEFGKMPMGGATGALLKRALAFLNQLVDQSISEVKGEVPGQRHIVSVASLIADAETAGRLAARARGCSCLQHCASALLFAVSEAWFVRLAHRANPRPGSRRPRAGRSH
jgi:hypothetical protein